MEKGPDFTGRDVYIDYPYMKVMFRWDYRSKGVFVKPYGCVESAAAIPVENKIFNEAILHGDKIAAEEYLRGK